MLEGSGSITPGNEADTDAQSKCIGDVECPSCDGKAPFVHALPWLFYSRVSGDGGAHGGQSCKSRWVVVSPSSLNWQQGDRVTRLFSECGAWRALAGVGGRRLGPGFMGCDAGMVEVLDLLLVPVHCLAVIPPCHLMYRPACRFALSIFCLALPVSVHLLSRLADWQSHLLMLTIPRCLGGRILEIVAYT